MTLWLRQISVTCNASADVHHTLDGQRFVVPAPRPAEFDLSGFCGPEDFLRDLLEDAAGLFDLFGSVAACEWCGALYPKKELRCRKGCGGPRTKEGA